MSPRPNPLRESQRYWRHRHGNRRVRRGRFLRRTGRLAVLLSVNLLIGLAVAVGVIKLFDNLTSGPQFDLSRVRLEGSVRSDPEGIEQALRPYFGRNLLRLDLEDVSGRLAARPWVKTARLRRVLPATLHVQVEEREPAAVADIRGVFHLVDREGFVLGPSGPTTADDLPVLLGLPEEDGALVDALRTGVERLARLRRASPRFFDELSELDVRRSDRIVARLRDGGPLLYLDPDRIDRNLDRFLALRPRLAKRFGAVRTVDLRWRDRIAVRPAIPS